MQVNVVVVDKVTGDTIEKEFTDMEELENFIFAEEISGDRDCHVVDIPILP